MKRARIALLPIVATSLLVFALAFSAWAWRRSAQLEETIHRKNDHWREIVRLQEELNALNRARELWDRSDRVMLTPVEDIFRRAAADLPSPELTERAAEPLTEGWRVRRVEAVFHDIPLTGLSHFLMLCAEATPPWKPTRMRVTASPSGRGYGQVRLTLEGLERGEESSR